MKRFLAFLVTLALLLTLFPAALAEQPATYKDVQTQYGLPDFVPFNLGMILAPGQMVVYNQPGLSDTQKLPFTRGVLYKPGENGGDGETVEGVYDEEHDRWFWSDAPYDLNNGIWSLNQTARSVIELTYEAPCAEGYRCEIVYRYSVLQENVGGLLAVMNDLLTRTGLRLYDADGAKVLEVWPQADEMGLRCMAVTFYPADGEPYTVECQPDKGDVADELYMETTLALISQNPAVSVPENPPQTLEEALALFPEADFTPDFIPEFDLDGKVVIRGIPGGTEVLYAVLQLRDMAWWHVSNWQLTAADDGTYVLADPAVLPRALEGIDKGMIPNLTLFYRAENGLVMAGVWQDGWWTSLNCPSSEGRAGVSWMPYAMVDVTFVDKQQEVTWMGTFHPETGELMEEYK